MKDYQQNIVRYKKVMGFVYGIWTLIWLGFVAAVIVFAADWQSALTLICIFAVGYALVYFRYRRNVERAVEEYRKRFEETADS